MAATLQQVRAHPIFKTLYPGDKEFMQKRALSGRLNEFASDEIEMTALIPFGIFPHIKTIAVVEMMLEDLKNGLYEGKHTIVVDSSGNTADGVARLAPAFGFTNVKIVLSTDVPESKKGILSALSTVELIEVPGGVAKRAREEGAREGHYHLNQYGHMGNMRAHKKFTGPAVLNALGHGETAVVAMAMGSGGTAGGVGWYLKELFPNIQVIGVRPKLGEQVPGARDENRMREVVTLPWQQYVDEVVDVSRKDAFIAMRRLWREVEPRPGPTSGLAYAGLTKYLRQKSVLERRLIGYKAGFVCPDDGRFYTERTGGELDPDQGV